MHQYILCFQNCVELSVTNFCGAMKVAYFVYNKFIVCSSNYFASWVYVCSAMRTIKIYIFLTEFFFIRVVLFEKFLFTELLETTYRSSYLL